MYTSIMELPTQVTMSLDEDDAKAWMDAYNKEDPKTEEDTFKARKAAWKACKDLPSSFSFCAIASVEDIDRDGEIISVESVLKHAEDYIRSGGNINNDHTNYCVGTCWDIEPYECEGKPAVKMWGNVFGGDEVYDNARKAFVKGINNVSIAGEADKGRFLCDNKGCYVKRDVRQLLEISLCRVPANRHATMIWFNEDSRLEKSADDFRLNVESYTLHRDYTTCPILGLRKSLREAGIDAHAEENGVFVAMSPEEYSMRAPMFKSIDLCSYYDGEQGGAILNRREALLERIFKSGFDNGYLDEDGDLTTHINKAQFVEMHRNGLIAEDGDRLSLVLPGMDAGYRWHILWHTIKIVNCPTLCQVYYGHRRGVGQVLQELHSHPENLAIRKAGRNDGCHQRDQYE